MEIEAIELDGLGLTESVAVKDAPISAEEKDQLDRIQSTASRSIGNPGLEAAKLGRKVDKFMNAKINNYIQEASNIQKTMDLLVHLNGKLSIRSEGENETAISTEIRNICDELKAKGIDVLSESEKKISRERLAEIKANVSSHTDRLKTDLQVLFTTKIQVSIQEVQSMLDTIKKTLEEYNRSINQIIGNWRNG